MNVLITTSVDPRHSAHGRLHEFINHLASENYVHVISARDYWKEAQPAAKIYEQEFEEAQSRIDLTYLTRRKSNMAVQELMSGRAIHRILSQSEVQYDLILDYNTILIGQNAAEAMPSVPRVYDLADDIVDMVRTSPRLPFVAAAPAASYSKVMIRRSIRNSDFVTGTTVALLDSYSVPREKRRVVPNGVEAKFFETQCGSGEQGTARDSADFVVGYVGVLREWVDFEPVLEAMKMLGDDTPVRLVIIGGEGGAGRIKKVADSYGLASRISWLGTIPHDRIRDYISSWDCGIIPFAKMRTTDNALPLKLFEYFACGLPVISTRMKGVEESFPEEVVFYEGVDDLAKILRLFHQNSETRREKGLRGREKCLTHFTWEKILPEFAALLSRLVHNHNDRSGRVGIQEV